MASLRAAGARSFAARSRTRRWSASTFFRPTRSTALPSCRWTSWPRTRPTRLKEALGGPADLVLSDMAANTVGHPQTDHLRTMGLVEAGLEFATEVLRPGGAYHRQGARRGHRQCAPRRAQAALRDGEACQAARQPQGFERVVRHCPGLQGHASRSALKDGSCAARHEMLLRRHIGGRNLSLDHVATGRTRLASWP